MVVIIAMNYQRSFPLLFFAWVAGLLVAVDAPADTETAEVQIVGDVIEYHGALTVDGNERVFALYDAASHKPTTLRIDSAGGSADAGMQLGTWMFEHSMHVSVLNQCLSSCANYVFTAGRYKWLGPKATLLWHGGATQRVTDEQLSELLEATLMDMSERDRGELLRHSSREDLIGDLKQSLQFLTARERRFFDRLGVDARIAVLGHLYESDLLQAGESFAGWDYSLEDLARLGVHDVFVLDGRAWRPRRSVSTGAIFRLRLDRLPDFEPCTSLPMQEKE